MAERGVHHLTFLSRSGAGNQEARAIIEDLNNRGVETDIIQGDVSIKNDVIALVKHACHKRHNPCCDGIRGKQLLSLYL